MDYVINPYTGCSHGCVYCYAEFMRQFTGHKEDWGTFVDIKCYRKSLAVMYYAERSFMISSVTDCYNHAERKYQKTRGILKQFINSECKVNIQTKSGLIVRDLEILRRIPSVQVGFSFSSLDWPFQKIMEPGASSPAIKLDALMKLHNAGIPVWVSISPVFPLLTDYKAIVQACRPYTNRFQFENLKLRTLCRGKVLKLIDENYPKAWSEYDWIYNQGGGDEYWSELKKEIAAYCEQEKLDYEIAFDADHKERMEAGNAAKIR
ncbi:MAG: radical SAM protein [Spirochaetaceae bacterium]|nr:radical SAM protein [Spirochaetaceae bacterium]